MEHLSFMEHIIKYSSSNFIHSDRSFTRIVRSLESLETRNIRLHIFDDKVVGPFVGFVG